MNPPVIPLHIGDYKRDTGHLRAAGHGAYLLLIMHHWSTGSLPDDDDELSAIACMTLAEWRKIKPTIVKFFQDGWSHKRVLSDLSKAKASYERRASAGSKGGQAKAMLQPCPSIATALLQQPYTLNLDKKDKIPADAGSSKYAFEDGIIRLNKRDFDAWQKAYSYLDLSAELLSLSKWAQDEGPDNWFFALKGALAKRNREVKAKRDALADQGGFKWNGVEGVL